jgi:hypothetical protein
MGRASPHRPDERHDRVPKQEYAGADSSDGAGVERP